MIVQSYLTDKWNPNWYYHSKSECTWSNCNEGAFHIHQTPGVELHHQMQFSIKPRT